MITPTGRSSASRSPMHVSMNFRRSTPASARPSLFGNVLSSTSLRRRRRKPTTTSLPDSLTPTEIVPSTTPVMAICKRQLQRCDTVLAALSLSSVILALCDSDYYFAEGLHETGWLQWLRLLQGLLTLLTCNTHADKALWKRYSLVNQLEKLHPVSGKYAKFLHKGEVKEGLLRSKYAKQLLLEIAVCSSFNPPFVNFTFRAHSMKESITYSLNDVLTSLALLRLYLPFRFLAHYSQYSTAQATNCCALFGVSDSTTFSLKCLFRAHPKTAIVVILTTLTTLFAMFIRIWERHLESNDLDQYYQNLWLVFVTSTTVGFGDVVPETHIGRAATVIACMGGSFYLGLFVQSVQQEVTLTTHEELVYAAICQKEIMKKARVSAGRAIACAITFFARRKRSRQLLSGPSLSFLFSSQYSQYRRHFQRFLRLQTQARDWIQSPETTLQRLISETKAEAGDLIAKCKSVIGGVGQVTVVLSGVLQTQREMIAEAKRLEASLTVRRRAKTVVPQRISKISICANKWKEA